MFYFNWDERNDFTQESQAFSDCPKCGGDMEAIYWWNNGKRGDFIEAKCEECEYTFAPQEQVAAVVL